MSRLEVCQFYDASSDVTGNCRYLASSGSRSRSRSSSRGRNRGGSLVRSRGNLCNGTRLVREANENFVY